LEAAVRPIGVTVQTGELDIEEILAYARLAEELGYDGFLPTEESGKDAFSVLALAAQATRRIRLGTAIISVYTRTPTLIAMEVAALDRYSRGRAMVGLGTGGPGFIPLGHGIPIVRPLTRVRETVAVVRGLLGGERFTFGGEFFQVQGFRLRERPLRAGVPVWIAALNPKMTALAGEVADGVIYNLLPVAYVAQARAQIAEGARRAGRDPGRVTLASLTVTCVEPGDPEAVDAARKTVAFYAAAPTYHHMLEAAGFGPLAREIAAAWHARQQQRAADLVSKELLEAVSLTGDRERVRQQLLAYLDLGVYPIIYPAARPGRVAEDLARAIRLVASLAS
jgi:probable F420-dependent oxidoreductase